MFCLVCRPELGDVPHLVYDSKHDGLCVKLWRGWCSGKFCCFPRYLITKERISVSWWNVSPTLNDFLVVFGFLVSGCCFENDCVVFVLSQLRNCTKITDHFDLDHVEDVELTRFALLLSAILLFRC
eukprot:c11933_g1_i2.p1 GENE.c11933_g1_i2~~c11933_g1_i2.p1  ORF type:complete len:126 (+),score=28.52 c11933_g1_i2:35-412(+)